MLEATEGTEEVLKGQNGLERAIEVQSQDAAQMRDNSDNKDLLANLDEDVGHVAAQQENGINSEKAGDKVLQKTNTTRQMLNQDTSQIMADQSRDVKSQLNLGSQKDDAKGPLNEPSVKNTDSK